MDRPVGAGQRLDTRDRLLSPGLRGQVGHDVRVALVDGDHLVPVGTQPGGGGRSDPGGAPADDVPLLWHGAHSRGCRSGPRPYDRLVPSGSPATRTGHLAVARAAEVERVRDLLEHRDW